WRCARHHANQVVAIFELTGQRLGLIRCVPALPRPAAAPARPAVQTLRLTVVTEKLAPASETSQPQQPATLADVIAAKLNGPPWTGRPPRDDRTELDPVVDEAGRAPANGAHPAARILLDTAGEVGAVEVPQGKGVS